MAVQEETGMSPRIAALIAGIGLLLMTAAAIFAEFYVRQGLVVPGDAVATVSNIAANESLYRYGVISFYLVAVLDVVVAWALYHFFRRASRPVSYIAAAFRIFYAIVLAVSLINLLDVMGFVDQVVNAEANNPALIQERVMAAFSAFDTGWRIGLVLFGLYLAMLGYMAIKCEVLPGWMGGLLLIAGAGYLFDSISKLMGVGLGFDVSIVTGMGELVFMVWLLVRGVRIPVEAKRRYS